MSVEKYDESLEKILEKYPCTIGIIGGDTIQEADVEKIQKIIIGLLDNIYSLNKNKELLFVTGGKTYLQYLFYTTLLESYNSEKSKQIEIINIPMNESARSSRVYKNRANHAKTTISGETVSWGEDTNEYILSKHPHFISPIFETDKDIDLVGKLPPLLNDNIPKKLMEAINTLKSKLNENPNALKGDRLPAPPKDFFLKNFYFTQLCDMYIVFAGGPNVQAEVKVLDMFGIPVVTIEAEFVKPKVLDLELHIDTISSKIISHINKTIIIKNINKKMHEHLAKNILIYSGYIIVENEFLEYLKQLTMETLQSIYTNINKQSEKEFVSLLHPSEMKNMVDMYFNKMKDDYLNKISSNKLTKSELHEMEYMVPMYFMEKKNDFLTKIKEKVHPQTSLGVANKYLKYKIKYTHLKNILV